MQSSILSAVFLPLALAVIMSGLGLSLTLDDFRRIAARIERCEERALPLVKVGPRRPQGDATQVNS